ncbi:hypothetical protein CPT_Seifer_038 [Klebsiella phage Seifer]|uniref:Uncharacterized protein n=1 Tax=Klebsiella phage Seifer TaxID=2315475 RepID=A0A3B8DIB9_9CAUD|nr:hypothetical protein HWB88_gp38 [Klebsiella phage Seifer]AYJ72820.1 hypothetical protein CPT_Seifer_038 [Klebsiella phage Seifer]
MTLAIKTVVAAIMAAAVIFALVWLHNSLAERHYQPTIDSLNKTLGSVKQHNSNLTAQLQAQNAVIASMAVQSEKDKQRITELEKAAQRGAGEEYGKANEVLQERTTGSDVCRAASDAFDAELRKERAK